MIEFIGWLGGVLFALCAIPQAIKTTRIGRADEFSHLMLWMWGGGEVLMLIYLLVDVGFKGPLFLNYAANILAVSWIMRYKYFPRESKNEG